MDLIIVRLHTKKYKSKNMNLLIDLSFILEKYILKNSLFAIIERINNSRLHFNECKFRNMYIKIKKHKKKETYTPKEIYKGTLKFVPQLMS